MNALPKEKADTVRQMLLDGHGVRAIEGMTGVHRDTVRRLRDREAIDTVRGRGRRGSPPTIADIISHLREESRANWRQCAGCLFSDENDAALEANGRALQCDDLLDWLDEFNDHDTSRMRLRIAERELEVEGTTEAVERTYALARSAVTGEHESDTAPAGRDLVTAPPLRSQDVRQANWSIPTAQIPNLVFAFMTSCGAHLKMDTILRGLEEQGVRCSYDRPGTSLANILRDDERFTVGEGYCNLREASGADQGDSSSDNPASEAPTEKVSRKGQSWSDEEDEAVRSAIKECGKPYLGMKVSRTIGERFGRSSGAVLSRAAVLFTRMKEPELDGEVGAVQLTEEEAEFAQALADCRGELLKVAQYLELPPAGVKRMLDRLLAKLRIDGTATTLLDTLVERGFVERIAE